MTTAPVNPCKPPNSNVRLLYNVKSVRFHIVLAQCVQTSHSPFIDIGQGHAIVEADYANYVQPKHLNHPGSKGCDNHMPTETTQGPFMPDKKALESLTALVDALD
jgi:hypothetical protein